MEAIKIAIIEDEFIVARDIAGHLENIGYEVAGIFDKGDDAISFLKHNEVDLALIDISIRGALDGIEVAEIIIKMVDIPIIYVTAYSDSITLDRAKRTKPSAFIVKPFNFENLRSAIELALFNYSNSLPADIDQLNIPDLPSSNGLSTHKDFFLKVGVKYQKLSPTFVFGLKASGSYTEIVLSDKRFTVSQNLRTILDKLKKFPFVRIHRSYAVNINHIQSIEDGKVTLSNGVWLRLGKAYKEELLRHIEAV